MINYFSFGKGSKNFVIIPGLSAVSVMPLKAIVEDMYSIFTEDYTVYLFDRRTDIGDVYTTEEMAKDTAEKMKELGIQNAVVFGVSQGGMIAMCVALAYPELVDCLIIGSSMARNSTLSREVFESWKNNPPADFCQGATDEEMRRFFVMTDALLNFDIYDRLPEIKCKAFAIGGRKDDITGVSGTIEIAEQLKCKSYIYEDYGHLAYAEAPDYMERVKAFLDESSNLKQS